LPFFSTAVPGKLPEYINYNLFALNIFLNSEARVHRSEEARPEGKVAKTRRSSKRPGERMGISGILVRDA